MASIGDIFFSFRGDDARLQADAKVQGAKAGTTLGQSVKASLKKSWSGGEMGKGLIQGLGLAGGLGAAALFSTAISKIGDVLSDATQAALEEEVSIQKLGSALKANVAGWDGNTAAIERTLTARMALGFSDDEQRESLAILVAKTGDVTKALNIQRAAMDLARLKSISLAEASKAIALGMGGSGRALKELGINVKDYANETEILTAIQAKAAGQAEDYANTNAGKLLVSQIKVGEAMEKLGAKTLPVLVTATTTAADAVEELSAAFTAVDDALVDLGGVGGALDGFAKLLRSGVGDPTLAREFVASWTKAGTDVSTGMGKAADDFIGVSGKVRDDMLLTEQAVDEVGAASLDMSGDMERATEEATDAWTKFKNDLVATANTMLDNVFDPLITAEKLAASNAEQAAARKVLASRKSTAAMRAEALSQMKTQAEYLLSLAESGDTTSDAYVNGMKELKKNIAAQSGVAKTELQGVYNWIIKVERAGKTVPINFVINTKSGQYAMPAGVRATGGPVTAGRAYLVNENTPRSELWVPSVSGTVYPTASTLPASARGAAGGTTNITVSLPTTARPDPFEVATQLRRLADFGVLSPVR